MRGWLSVHRYLKGIQWGEGMRGVIVSYRRGRHTMHPKQVIVAVDGVSTRKQASSLVGKHVIWRSPSGKKFKGVVVAPHGNKGKVRARFEKGIPGQAIGESVEIL